MQNYNTAKKFLQNTHTINYILNTTTVIS